MNHYDIIIFAWLQQDDKMLNLTTQKSSEICPLNRKAWEGLIADC